MSECGFLAFFGVMWFAGLVIEYPERLERFLNAVLARD